MINVSIAQTHMQRKTFLYRLYPSKPQVRLLDATLETCRHWYNQCLAERKNAYEQEQHTVGKYEQLAKVKDVKTTNPYAKNVHSHILQTVVQDLDKAFASFFRRVKTGQKAGYPRFRGRNRWRSFGFKEILNGFKVDGRRLKLSGIGRVAIRWHRPIEGQIKTLRISKKAGKWYASFSCVVDAVPLPATGTAIGLDVGLTALVTTSTGEKVENPRWYRSSQKALRVAQRRVARRMKGSNRRRKAVRILQHKHEHITYQRKDFLNKLVHGFISRYDVIAVENLNIARMVHGNLAKSILDAGWNYFVMQLTHKAESAGRKLEQVDPRYTSKTCSQCEKQFETLTLKDRWVQCDCGLSLDRDHNAAINILKRAGYVRREPSSSIEGFSREAVGL